VIRAFGSEIVVHLSGEQTGGKFAMFTSISQPGDGPPPHSHAQEDEWFIVLEGHAQFFKDGAWIDAPVGTSVFTPRGVVHTFRNAGDTTLRMLVHAAPAGFEVFYARCEEEFAKAGGPDMARVMAIAGEHGICFTRP
jgi:quercetin dioxygenase-like cupin family protein